MGVLDVAIIGATGAVGEAVVELLEKREFPIKQLYLLASERTAGTSLLFNKQTVMVQNLEDFDFALVKLAIFVATDEVSREYLPKAQASGCLVIDNSPVFADVAPLIVPSVNGDIFAAAPTFVVNPDSNALVLSTVLKPLDEFLGVENVCVTAMQSVSGLGKKAINELAAQTASLLNGRGAETQVFAKQIAFNALPCVGGLDEFGHSEAEVRLQEQTQRILGNDDIEITAMSVQLPVFYSDCLSVTIQARAEVNIREVTTLFQNNSEIKVMDGEDLSQLATPVTDVTGEESIFISRIRGDKRSHQRLSFWVSADNVRKSAAVNTILIAEELIKSYL